MYWVLEKETEEILAMTKHLFIVKTIIQKFPNQCIVRYRGENKNEKIQKRTQNDR